MLEKDKEAYLDVVLKICGELYAINSRYVISIMEMPKYNYMPGAPKEILGVIDFWGDAIPLIDMRTLFGLPTVKQEFQEFKQMLDEKKADHIKWVDELERSTKNGEQFTLATDPHQCAFGKWFYNFESDSAMINHHMAKIEEPHRKLHEAAMEMHTCSLFDDESQQENCMNNTLDTAREEHMTKILSLLDEAKEVFKGLYTEMLVVLEGMGHKVAIVIDEVLDVENLVSMERTIDTLAFQHSDYICDIKQRSNGESLILELSDDKLLRKADDLPNT